mmetsp:Transcript_5294/g.11392  ORF Transcript_5294/g.11392 Transcript_5294/m.11392 type:complete len:176 (+) Transcript_5294:301-828(+)
MQHTHKHTHTQTHIRQTAIETIPQHVHSGSTERAPHCSAEAAQPHPWDTTSVTFVSPSNTTLDALAGEKVSARPSSMRSELSTAVRTAAAVTRTAPTTLHEGMFVTAEDCGLLWLVLVSTELWKLTRRRGDDDTEEEGEQDQGESGSDPSLEIREMSSRGNLLDGVGRRRRHGSD